MEILAFLVEIFPTVGFPIIACGVMVWFIYKIYQDSQRDKERLAEENKANMAAVQARCQEREEKLYNFMIEQSETNAKFAEIIAQYEIKLDDIKADVKDIKQDITEIKAKQA